MTDGAMRSLRRRMIEDMTIRKLGRKTQQDYIQIIKKLAAFLGRSPDTATFEDLRRFQLHVVTSGVGTAAINRHVSALRFFFRVTLKRYAIVEHTHFIHEPCKLPVVLSQQEVAPGPRSNLYCRVCKEPLPPTDGEHVLKYFLVDRPRKTSSTYLYGRNLPDMVILTRSPFGFGSRSICMSKSIADMMPSPNSSSISAFHAGPLIMTSS
jgi:hypothetical protein